MDLLLKLYSGQILQTDDEFEFQCQNEQLIQYAYDKLLMALVGLNIVTDTNND